MNIQKPLVIADFFNGGEMAWAWWHEHHSRLAIVGDNHISPKRAIVQQIARQVHQRDPKAVYWITGEEQKSLSEVFLVESILWTEQYPDPSEEYADSQTYVNNRKFFSASFLQLLAGVKGVSRQDMFPPSAYRPSLEGPLLGHLRSLEAMPEVQNKEWLRNEFKALEKVVWYKTKGEGMKYHIERSESLYETALSFLKAIWSFWAHTANMDDPQQLLLIIEPPKELLLPNTPPHVKEIVGEALRIMKYLTEVTTTSLVLASETLYPVPHHHYRYTLMFQTKDSDVDLWENTNREAINFPPLYEAWDNGKIEAGIWEDHFTKERYAAFFRTDAIEFDDEFKEL
jgi:hypothetical protein